MIPTATLLRWWFSSATPFYRTQPRLFGEELKRPPEIDPFRRDRGPGVFAA
jgi:hypothetical protein